MTHRYLIRFVVKNSSFYGSLGDQYMTSKLLCPKKGVRSMKEVCCTVLKMNSMSIILCSNADCNIFIQHFVKQSFGETAVGDY